MHSHVLKYIELTRIITDSSSVHFKNADMNLKYDNTNLTSITDLNNISSYPNPTFERKELIMSKV
jgi:hypothetical protein